MTIPQKMFEKIWLRHVILDRGDNDVLLYVDRNFLHEGSFRAFAALAAEGLTVRRPRQNFATADHNVPTRNRHLGLDAFDNPELREMVATLARNADAHDIKLYGLDHPLQGIVHVIGPELGITQPGITLTCGDSHTSTHGAFGAYALGIGASQLKQILATQCLWQSKPKTMRVTLNGAITPGVYAKDVVLALIAKIGTAGATGHAVEYAGSTVRALSMEGRLTLCNMSIEAGARSGMIAPDETTFSYLAGRAFAPKGKDWDRALAFWRSLPSDDDASFDREVSLDVAALAPMVTWGTNPEEAVSITASVPDPDSAADPDKRSHARQALAYMRLSPGIPLESIAIDRVFIGTCTNGRIEDMRAAASVLKGRKAVVPVIVSPGSSSVKRQAEAEGLDRIFQDAGFEWRGSGCSSCTAQNGDTVPAGERCVSTSNRNFEGRQGKNALTHLVSPAMAAAAAVTGKLTDVRKLMN
jgi:3-isopropylmalate/(R)-2-methylmalate dehydratase large subunit